MSLQKQLVSGVGWNTLTVVLQAIIQLTYTSILHRLLPETAFALMGVVLALVGFAEIFSQIGFGPALIQRKDIQQKHIDGAFWTSIGLGLLFTIGFYFAAPFIADFYAIPALKNIIRVVACSFTISAIGIVPRSLLFKKLGFKQFFKAGMVSIIGGNLIIGLILAYTGFGVWAYVWALFAQGILMTIMVWVLNPIKIGFTLSKKHIRELLSYGAMSTIFNSLNYLATKLDVIILPKLLGGSVGFIPDKEALVAPTKSENLDEAGQYERSTYIMMQPITIMGKLSDNIMFSGLSAMQDDKKALRKTFMHAIYLVATIMFPAGLFVVFFSQEVVDLFLGPKYDQAALVVRILFSVVALRSIIKLCDALLRATNRLGAGAGIKILFLAAVAVGTFFGVKFGIKGVATGVAAATLLQFIIMLTFCASIIDLNFGKLFRTVFPALRLCIVVAAVSLPLWWVFQHFEMHFLIRLGVAIVVNLIAVVGAILVYPKIMSNGDENMLAQILAKLPQHKLVKRLRDKM